MIDKNSLCSKTSNLHEISPRENNFGDLNWGTKCTDIKFFEIYLLATALKCYLLQGCVGRRRDEMCLVLIVMICIFVRPHALVAPI